MTPEEKYNLNQFESLKRHQAFKVPERYFDTFDERMHEVVKRHNATKGQLLIQMIKPWLTVAAIFIVVAIVYNVFNPFKNDEQLRTSSEDTEELFTPIFFELTEYDLVTYVVDEDISLSTDAWSNDDLSDLTQNELDDLILY